MTNGEMDEDRALASLHARWQSQPALSLAVARAVWGERPWPDLVRYRVITFHPGHRHRYLVADICHSSAAAWKYVAGLRRLGVGGGGPYDREIHVLRSKLAPSHVLVKTRIPVLMWHYEPPHVIDLIALLVAPSGRVKACYEDGGQRRFGSLRDCLAFYHRDAAWLARRKAYHLLGT